MSKSQHPLIVDAHLDLSMNAMDWNRDLTQDIQAIRKREAGQKDKPDRGNNVVSFDEMRRGNIGLCVATLIARYVKASNALPGWFSPAQAWSHTQGQLTWYKTMEEMGHLYQITDLESLNIHLSKHGTETYNRIGYVLSLEGADSVVDLSYVERYHDKGLRAIGPAHYGPGTYAFGTHCEGSIGQKGKELLSEMERLNIILDVTHLSDTSFWEAIDHFNGPIWASHSNCRSLVSDQRQFDDEQLRVLIERGAVIGASFDAWMLVPGWKKWKSIPSEFPVSMEDVVNHMDHICQIAGNCNHIGLGTDLDGGFGSEQSPHDIGTIADLQKMTLVLSNRGYNQDNINQILGRNWIDFLKRTWSN